MSHCQFLRVFITGYEPRTKENTDFKYKAQALSLVQKKIIKLSAMQTMQGEQMSREDKILSEYEKLRNGLEKVETMMSQMTQQQIRQSSEYIKSHFKQYDDFDMICDIILLIDKVMKDKKKSDELGDTIKRIEKVLEIVQEAENQDDFMDWQEPTMINSEQTINIESEIDNKKSNELMHQIIESIETENFVDDLLQVQQQQEPHHQTVEVVTIKTIIQVQQSAQPQAPQKQQPKPSEYQIKVVDNTERQAKLEQIVFGEIEGQIELDADNKFDYVTLNLEQMEVIKVKKSDTFRGGTEFEFIYNPSAIMLLESDDKTMEEIMFGAQTAKQSQRKHQDSMKGNPNSEVKHKTQKSVRFKIEEDKVIEAHVTHWQELESQDRVQQWQELKSNQITIQFQALDQQCLVWQECDGGVKESKPSTLSPSQFSHYIPSHH